MFYFGPTVHTLRVRLDDVEPEVWRRIIVPSATPLPDLARILVVAMGWQGYHLHQFEVAGLLFGEVDADSDRLIDERVVTVSQILPRVDAGLRWEYDFGDGWSHVVVVEEIAEPTPKTRHPMCVDGANACPPEDCGGPWGYQELRSALGDPTNPEHEDMVTWAPEGFDPSRFDATATNRALRAIG